MNQNVLFRLNIMRTATHHEMTLRPCPMCGSAEANTLFQVPAELFCKVNSTYCSGFAAILEIDERTLFPIVRCAHCSFVYARLLPSERFLALVYDEVIDPTKGFLESVKPSWVGHQLGLASLLLRELSSVFGSEADLKILDYGCGFGSLLKAVHGPRVTGVGFETSERRLTSLQAESFLALSTPDAVWEEGPYHGVILSDVLEHVPNPREIIRFCRDLLIPGGILSISVPCFPAARLRSIAASLRNGELMVRELNPWEHLNYFSPASLYNLLTAEGLKPKEPFLEYGVRPGRGRVRQCAISIRSLWRTLCWVLTNRPQSTYFHAHK